MGKVNPKRILEALLFSTGQGMSVEELSRISGIPIGKTKKYLSELEKEYNTRSSDESALMIIHEGNVWRMIVRETYTSYTSRIVAELEMKRPVLSTLAVIAWKSPVMQSEVVKIRGTPAYDHIKELEEKDFITKEKKGHSYILRVTDRFKQYFEVRSEKDIRSLLDEARPVIVNRPSNYQDQTKNEEDKLLEEKIRMTDFVKKKREEILQEIKDSKDLLERADQVLRRTREMVKSIEIKRKDVDSSDSLGDSGSSKEESSNIPQDNSAQNNTPQNNEGEDKEKESTE